MTRELKVGDMIQGNEPGYTKTIVMITKLDHNGATGVDYAYYQKGNRSIRIRLDRIDMRGRRLKKGWRLVDAA